MFNRIVISKFHSKAKRRAPAYSRVLLQITGVVQTIVHCKLSSNCQRVRGDSVAVNGKKHKELKETRVSDSINICDQLWRKQAVGLKISFVHFSLKLINNNFCLICLKNYYSIFSGSKDLNFIVL